MCLVDDQTIAGYDGREPGRRRLARRRGNVQELAKVIAVRGLEGRKMVIDYMKSLRQYTYHIRRGDESRDAPLEESEWPDGWVGSQRTMARRWRKRTMMMRVTWSHKMRVEARETKFVTGVQMNPNRRAE